MIERYSASTSSVRAIAAGCSRRAASTPAQPGDPHLAGGHVSCRPDDEQAGRIRPAIDGGDGGLAHGA